MHQSQPDAFITGIPATSSLDTPSSKPGDDDVPGMTQPDSMTNIDGQLAMPSLQAANLTSGHMTPGGVRREQMSRWGLQTDLSPTELDQSSANTPGLARTEVKVCDCVIDDIISLNRRPYEMSVVPGHFRDRDVGLEAMSYAE